MKPLYFAPLNQFSNAIYRHYLLSLGADFVFSELILVDKLKNDFTQKKLDVYEEDLSKTIFQIGIKNNEEVKKGVKFIKQNHKDVVEINLNAGCPQSSMQTQLTCGGLLYNKEFFFEISKTLANECKKANCIPSVKLRLGTSPEDIQIKSYLELLEKARIKKVYIHARPLRYNYTKPAMYAYFKDLKKSFPNFELIFNGDIDSYDRYKEFVDLGADGVMVGRAALSNQEIFSQIKNKKVVKTNRYDPFRNDPQIDFSKGTAKPTQKKKETFIAFVSLAEKHNFSLDLTKRHLLHATKGLGGRTVFSKSIREAENVSSLIKILQNL